MTTDTTCPTCKGGGLFALCGSDDTGSGASGCVLRGGHTGPHYGPEDVASDWTPADRCPSCLGTGWVSLDGMEKWEGFSDFD